MILLQPAVQGGVVVLSVGLLDRTSHLWVAGSSPASAPLRSGLRQATWWRSEAGKVTV